MPQATFINPVTRDRKAAEIGSRQAEDLFAADYVLEQSPGVAVQPTSPTDPRLRDFNVQSPTVPQGTRNLPELGSGGLNIGQASTPAVAPQVPQTDYGQFGIALMDLLKQQQQLGTAGFAEQGFAGQEEQVRRIQETDQDLIGASPALQGSVRAASVGAVQPTVSGAQAAQRTLSEQIGGLGDAIAQARGIGQWMQQIDQQAQQEAIDFLYKFPSAVQAMEEKELKDFAKRAGVTPEMILAIPEQQESIRSQVIEVGGRKKLINLDTGDTIQDFGFSELEDVPSTIDTTVGTNIGEFNATQIGEAIKHIESRGDYNARGPEPTNEIGAYQFLPSSWEAWSGEYLRSIGEAPQSLQPTPENQDAVANFKIQGYLDQGLTAQEIAAQWNGGDYRRQNAQGQYVNTQGVTNVQDYVNKFVGALPGGLGDVGSLEEARKEAKLAQIRNGLLTRGDASDVQEEYKDDPVFLAKVTEAFDNPKNRTISATEAAKYNVDALTTSGQLDQILAARKASGFGNKVFQGLHNKPKEYQNIIQWLEMEQDIINVRALKEGSDFTNTLSESEQQRIVDFYGDTIGVESIEELTEYDGVNTGPIAKGSLGVEEFLGAAGGKSDKIQIALDVISGKYKTQFMKEISGVAISEPEAIRLGKLVPHIGLQDTRFKESAVDAQDSLNADLLGAARKFGFNSVDELRRATEQTQAGGFYDIDNRTLSGFRSVGETAPITGVTSSGISYTIEQ